VGAGPNPEPAPGIGSRPQKQRKQGPSLYDFHKTGSPPLHSSLVSFLPFRLLSSRPPTFLPAFFHVPGIRRLLSPLAACLPAHGTERGGRAPRRAAPRPCGRPPPPPTFGSFCRLQFLRSSNPFLGRGFLQSGAGGRHRQADSQSRGRTPSKSGRPRGAESAFPPPLQNHRRPAQPRAATQPTALSGLRL
jgi:hypothetical protein